KLTATKRAIRGSIEPIVASGGTVIAGLLTLLLSELKSNSTHGPVAAIGIVFAMLSALTLLPAILYAFGRTAFWPVKVRFDENAAPDAIKQTGGWAGLARLIKRRPRVIWIATTLVLAAGAIGVTQVNASGVAQSELVLGTSEARDGQVALGEHFPGGSGSPVYVLTAESEFDAVT